MRNVLMAALLILPLGGCAVPPALSLASLVMDAGSYAASGKSMTDHGISILAGGDCALFNLFSEGSVCRERPAFETAVAALEPLPGTAPGGATAEPANEPGIAAAPFLADGLPRGGEALLPRTPRLSPAAAFLADGNLRGAEGEAAPRS